MKKGDYLLLFIFSLSFLFLVSFIQKVPGYMDAEYYFGQAIQLAEERGFSEPFIWNYLNNPSTIPVEGFSFWLPVTSIIASFGLSVSGMNNFFIARIPFILISATIPLLAAYLACQFMPTRRAGWLAGGLALLSGFYLPFITITDTFTPYMIFGGLFLIVANRLMMIKKRAEMIVCYLLIGLIIGLMTLTRSDGLFWLVAGVLVIIYSANHLKQSRINLLTSFLSVFLGFGLVMIAWYIRNLTIYQSIYPPGNSLMLWLTNYNDLFVYPSSNLSFSQWIETGFLSIIVDRIKALGSNLQTLIASGGAIFLVPLIAAGFWKLRKNNTVKIAAVMLLILLGVMTVLFPYAGERGGFFHSLASLQIILWAMVPSGLETFIQWGVSHRKWKFSRAWSMFGIAIMIAVAGLSAFVMIEKIENGPENGIAWNHTQDEYIFIESGIVNHEIDQNNVVMVNNPAGYTLATGRKSVMIPANGSDAILAACQAFDVGYLVINDERQDVKSLMDTDRFLQERFSLVFETESSQIYEYKP